MNGTSEINQDLVKAFDERKQIRSADEKYGALEVEICDVNVI